MSTLPDFSPNLHRKKNRLEREPFNASSDSMRWRARCMHVGCAWLSNELPDGEPIRDAAQKHSDATGHPVKLRAVVEFECGIIRSAVR